MKGGRAKLPGRGAPPETVSELLASGEASLLDVVDHVLNQGVVVSGDAILGVAGVDLIYLRLAVLFCAADRAAPKPKGGRGL
ncbi:MAG: gas vesicle protein [Deltaproteobacteria bacterium]